YDDLCHDDAAYDNTCDDSDTVSSLMLLKGNIFIDKRPEVVFTEINQAQWTIHVTNAGAGPASNVTIVDTLAGGHEYAGSLVSPDNGDVATNLVSAQEVHWVIDSMAAGEVRTITINSNLVSCDPLGNTVDATWGCHFTDFPDETCQIVDQDASTVEIPTPNLVSTSVTVNTQDMCDVEKATITLRNAGQTHVYDLIAAQTLPTGMKYAGNAEYRFWDDSAGTWTPAGPVWTPGPDPNNGGPTVSPLVWSHEDGGGAGPLALLMDDLDRGDIIEIRFDIEAACDFTGGSLDVETQYK
ncbi:MAG: DUF11 domain-containing protein, partial [bacterium]|nr:DUF11 domain-containing protein [bacterium]